MIIGIDLDETNHVYCEIHDDKKVDLYSKRDGYHDYPLWTDMSPETLDLLIELLQETKDKLS